MAKVVRIGSCGVKSIKARDLVPGDVVEIAGWSASIYYFAFPHYDTLFSS